LDINLEPEGEEIDEYPENVFIDEGVEEVEVVEEPMYQEPEPTPEPSPPPKKGLGKKKILLTIVVVILVIIAAFAIYIFIPKAPTGITLHATESEDGHSLRLSASIASESATESSGEAKISISYEGEEVYNNNAWEINSNYDTIEIPYNEFVVENGFYDIDVEFQGVSDSATFEVKFVIEDASITTYNTKINDVTYQPEFTLRATFEFDVIALPKDADVKVAEVLHEDGIHEVTSGIDEWESVDGQGQYEDVIEYEESGNYTVTLEIRNNDVKSSSEYYDFEVEGPIMLNAIPIAKIVTEEGDGNENHQVRRGTTVHFDGTFSIDDSDDNHNIVIWDWFFEDTNQHEYDPEVDHTFNTLNPDPERDSWMVTLTITDDGHGEDGKYNLAFVNIVVTL
jgi:hypothetical protein